MSVGWAYLLDANVFIEAARRYYAFDLVPRFWTSLVELSRQGRILSVDRVRQELERGRDQLAEWATNEFAEAFVATDSAEVLVEYRKVIAWVTAETQFMEAAKDQFARDADGWLVAYAKSKGHVVVTQEQLSMDARRRVPIPNVCNALGVRYVDTFGMLRELGIRLT